MRYPSLQPAIFLHRPNRFVAHIQIDGQTRLCHVKNTGRCKELLIPGAMVLVQPSESAARRTPYDLIAVYKGERLVNIDSQAPNRVFAEWALGGHFVEDLTLLQPERRFQHSRFDYYVEYGGRRGFVEVKGVTLEQDGVALFPDAPTDRGVRHVQELIACRQQGFEAWLVFIIQMNGVHYFTPHAAMHPAFARAVAAACREGVNILALDCRVTQNSITAGKPVEVVL